ncbi:MAG: DUF2794 domain-containing protein [Hyphomicrobiales bacterium]|jgi:hypothetical protein|nr:DUF2794 domain-containing protein [Hyphomicrobiales bacterium]
MSETDPIVLPRGIAARAKAAHGPVLPAGRTSFSRGELDQILQVYGRKVAAGEWRDYAIDMLGERAVFSVFRRACEFPLFRIEKNPRLARRQGAYAVVAASGVIVRRGHSLENVLKVLDRRLRLVEA